MQSIDGIRSGALIDRGMKELEPVTILMSMLASEKSLSKELREKCFAFESQLLTCLTNVVACAKLCPIRGDCAIAVEPEWRSTCRNMEHLAGGKDVPE